MLTWMYLRRAPTFVNADTNSPKKIECIRVNGAADEGPSHVEVQWLFESKYDNSNEGIYWKGQWCIDIHPVLSAMVLFYKFLFMG